MYDLLKKQFLFKNCDFESIDKNYSVTRKIIRKEYGDGKIILPDDEGIRGIFIVTQGKAEIVSVSKKHDAPLRILLKGDTFGAASLYGTETNHRTKVIAKGQMSAVILPFPLIDELIRNEADVSINYIEFLSDRVGFLNKKIAAFSAGSADEKLALYLLSLPFENGICTLEESYTVIAKSLDVGRASLYRSIETFENSGIIRREGRRVYLVDKEKLLSMIN